MGEQGYKRDIDEAIKAYVEGDKRECIFCKQLF